MAESLELNRNSGRFNPLDLELWLDVNIETIIVPVASVPMKRIYPNDIVASSIQAIGDGRGVLFSLLESI